MSNPDRLLRLVWLLACLLFAPALHAETRFADLSPDQQQVLAPFQSEWASLQEADRLRLLATAERWLAAQPEQRRAAAERFARWQSLDPAQRERLRQRYQWFQAQPPERQRQLRQTMQRFRHLPPDERRRLRERFQGMTAEQREAFLEGARASERAGQMQRFWQRFTPAEREQLRHIDAGLSEEQRLLLRHRLRSAAPAEREGLMRQWLQMDDSERASWLQPR